MIELLNVSVTILSSREPIGQCNYGCEKALSHNYLNTLHVLYCGGPTLRNVVHLGLRCSWETMQVCGSVILTNRLLMISGQNSTINMAEAGNTSNATLASVTLNSASPEAKTLSAAATELPYVEF